MARAHKAPGKHYRKGISIKQLFKLFPTNKAAEKWFQKQIWKGVSHCPRCGSTKVNMKANHPTMPHRCKEKGCYKFFSAKTGTVMEASNIGYRDWPIAMYLHSTNLKGISSIGSLRSRKKQHGFCSSVFGKPTERRLSSCSLALWKWMKPTSAARTAA